MPTSTAPAPDKCPYCGRKKSVKRVGQTLYCINCRAQFDDSPDEGGDYSDRNPAARLERDDRVRDRKRDRLGRR